MPQLKPTRGILLDTRHPLARGLVGCWLFNEGSGNKVFDLSGNENTGVLTGLSSPTAGHFGSAIDFDGVSGAGEINIPFGSQLDGKHLSIVAWINWNQDNDDYPRIVDRQYNGQFSFYLGDLGNKVSWALATAGGDVDHGVVGATTVISQNEWVQVVLTYDGDSAKVYANGILGDITSTGISGGLDSSTDDIIIGEREDGSGRLFDGQIDHVMIWDRALAAFEIALLYREPFCMFERAIRPGLIGSQIINFAGTSAALSSLSATAKAIRKVSGTVAGTSNVAALLSSIRGEESSLGLERNWFREALFNGMTANAFKLGTTLSLGWFWVRVAGCSVLYRGPSVERINFTSILIVAEQNACEFSPPSYIPHNNSSIYFYVIRRFSNCGYQELTLTAAAKVSIDASGELEKPQPNNIFSSKAEQVDGNKIQLVWFYCPLRQKSQPVCFNVYYDGGMGQIDYENPLAKISYEGRRFYRYQSGALGAGGYLFTIRAEDADGVENSSSAQLKIQLDTTNPNAIDILSTETV